MSRGRFDENGTPLSRRTFSSMRRAVSVLLLALGISLGIIGAMATASAIPATAPDTPTPPRPAVRVENGDPFVDVIEVSGLIDPVMKQFILDSLDTAERDGAEALVIQLNSPGSVLSRKELDGLELELRNNTAVPIAVWVGPQNSRAKGGAVRLIRAADVAGMAPSTEIGRSTDPIGTAPDSLRDRVIDDRTALREHEVQLNEPVLRFFVAALDGRQVDGRRITTAKAVFENGRPKIDAKTKLGVREVFRPRFTKLALLPRLLHTMTNPSVAYLLFGIGLALMVFEFFTGGVGVAASVGIGAAALASYGLGQLPLRGVAIVLLLAAFFGFAVDIQAGSPRFWTAAGTVLFVVGSLFLYRDGLRVPWYFIGILTALVVLFMVNGMPSMVRTRFATPTIGRESMVGSLGESRSAVDPDGVVLVAGAPWRARTNRATPIAPGAPIRVVAIDGLLLEVEPLEGGAKDAHH